MKKIPFLAFLVTLMASAAMADSSWGVGSLQSVTNAGATTTTAIGWGGGYGDTGCSGTIAGDLYCDGTIFSMPNATATFGAFALTDYLLTDWILSQDTNTVWGIDERGAGTATTTGNVEYGKNNTLFGYNAGHDLSTGFKNTCIGSMTCENPTTHNSIVAVGYGAGTNATDYTVAIGARSLQAASTYNTAVGYNTLRTTTGTENVAVGINAGETAQNGNSVFVGSGAGKAATGGQDVFIGKGSGDVATGGYGVGVGYESLANASSGGSNVAVGAYACDSVTSGRDNICLGRSSDMVDGTKSFRMSIYDSFWGDYSAGAAGSSKATSTARFGIATSTLNAALSIAIPTTNTYDVIQANNGGSGDFIDYYDDGVPVMSVTDAGLITATAGIRFDGNGDTMDFYDEGTWTPAVTGTTAGDCATGTTAVGKYTRVGNMVHVDMSVTVTACAIAPTGTMRISLPSGLTPSSLANYVFSGSVGFINNYTLTANNIMTILGSGNSAYIYLYQTPFTGGAASAAPVDTAWAGYFSVTYLMD